jgi:hypothetical protein
VVSQRNKRWGKYDRFVYSTNRFEWKAIPFALEDLDSNYTEQISAGALLGHKVREARHTLVSMFGDAMATDLRKSAGRSQEERRGAYLPMSSQEDADI